MSENLQPVGFQLWPHQVKAVDAIRQTLRQGEKTALVVASTGSGKTLLAAEFIRQMVESNPRFKCMVLVPKIKLTTQMSGALRRLGVDHGVLCASLGRYEIKPIQIATFQTMMNNTSAMPKFDCVILDEAHRFDPNKMRFNSIYHSETRTVGFTATPFRENKPLWLLGEFWREPCFKVGIKELTRDGYLVKARMVEADSKYSLEGVRIKYGDWDAESLQDMSRDHDKLKTQVEEALVHLNKHMRKSVIWIAVDQEHARSISSELQMRGESSCVVIASNSLEERDDTFDGFSRGTIRHLVSVMIASEGFDEPRCDAVVFMRPTRSITLYIQAVGRALRIHPNKTYSLVLDFGQVVRNCGKLDDPYIPKDNLARDSRKLRQEIADEAGYYILRCEKCGEFSFPDRGTARLCSHCGYLNPDPKLKKLQTKAAEGELYSDECEHPFGRYLVLSMDTKLTDDELIIDFTHDSEGIRGKTTMRFFCPRRLISPTVFEMGQMRRTKYWLSRAFDLDKSMTAREMASFVFECGYMPRQLILDGTNIVAKGRQEGRRSSVEKAQQESMF